MQTVSITRGEKTYEATYVVKDGMIAVTCNGVTQKTEVGGMKGSEEALARVMLGEMIKS